MGEKVIRFKMGTKGKTWKLSEENKLKMSKIIKEKYAEGTEMGFKKGNTIWRGREHTEESKEKISKKLNKGGYTNWQGYKIIQDKRKDTREHRKIWEEHNGPIPKGYVIHHIDEDKLNNNIDNLAIMSRSEHAKHHHGK